MKTGTQEDGEDKSRAFVLPTHSENFGMVVAEALAHGCPAVASRGAPWAGLKTEGCGMQAAYRWLLEGGEIPTFICTE